MKRSASSINDVDGCNPAEPKLPRLPLSMDVNDDSEPVIDNRIKVCVRVRPLKPIELENNTKSIIDVIDKSMLVFDPYIYDENNEYEYHGKRYKEIGKKASKNLQFNFDRVFNDQEDNLTVYTETTKNLVKSLLAGYNCSVFAYGSTGSGKTHTMLGSKNDPGVIFFTTMDLYKHIDAEKNKNLELKISYFEIYNEVIYDLLDPTSTQPLSVLENANKSMTVKNLSIHQPKDAEHLIEMLEYGNQNRKQHPTDSNAESSRSHAVFQITLQRKDYSDDQEMSIQVSKMSLIDLAGSERATNAYKTYRNDNLHREGGNINKSLLSLGNCIHALTSNKKNVYVPYRSSKLTLILRDSLGGNCQTLMIATVSPSINQYEETHNTLIYAQRAQGIQLNAQKNSIFVGVQPRDYKHMFENMTREKAKLMNTINELKQQIEKYKNRAETIPENPISSDGDALSRLNAMKNILDDLFERRIELRTKYLDCEHNLKLLDYRLLYREYVNERLKLLDTIGEESRSDQTKGLHSIYGQKLHYSNLKSTIEQEMEENENRIMKLENELLTKTNNDIVVRAYFQENHYNLKQKNIELLKHHHQKMIEELSIKYGSLEELLENLLQFNYKSYHILNGLGKLSNEMDEKYSSIIQKIKDKKNVIWCDDIDPSLTLNNTKTMLRLFSLPIYDSNQDFNNTPDTNRQLVNIRDITPRVLRSMQNHMTPKHNSMNLMNNIGNTMTKCRNISTINNANISNSPRPLLQSQIHHREKSLRYYNGYNYNYKSPKYYNDNNNNNNNNQWQKSVNTNSSSSMRKRNYYRNNNYGFNNNSTKTTNSPFVSSTTSEKFSYNPNFRPKFRF